MAEEDFFEDGNWQFRFIPEFADCIARIASLWARLEYDLNVVIWKLADVRPALGACMTAQMYTFSAKLNALLSLAKLRQVDEKLIKKINCFSKDFRDALETRNRTLHDLWLNDRLAPGNMGRLRITADKTLKFFVESVPLPELRNDLLVVEKRIYEFAEIRVAIEAALPSLPDIPHAKLHPIIENPTPA